MGCERPGDCDDPAADETNDPPAANDPGVPANPDPECPKARCVFAMDPGTYTLGSWGETTFDGRGYKSYNRKDDEEPDIKPDEPTKPIKG